MSLTRVKNITTNLGLSQANPDAELHISTVRPHIDIEDTAAGARAKIGSGYANMYIAATHSGGEIIFKNGVGSSDFPHASGTTRMVIGATGYVTMPNVPAFYVKGAALNGVDASGSTIVPAGTNYWNSSTLEQNGGTNFNISNARFTAPVSGWYTFNYTARVDQFAGSYVYITLVSSRDSNIGRDLRSISTTYQTLTVLTTTYLAANDYVYPELNAAGDSSINWDSDTYFSGHLVG